MSDRLLAMLREAVPAQSTDLTTWDTSTLSADMLSPAAHEMACELAGLPPNSALTRADLSRAQQALYDRCTPEEKDRLVAIALGGRW